MRAMGLCAVQAGVLLVVYSGIQRVSRYDASLIMVDSLNRFGVTLRREHEIGAGYVSGAGLHRRLA